VACTSHLAAFATNDDEAKAEHDDSEQGTHDRFAVHARGNLVPFIPS